MGGGRRAAKRRYACPCCRHCTLAARGEYFICPVCFWEDDGNNDPARGFGPNGALTLAEGRANYQAFGACEERFRHLVREPRPGERRGPATN